MTSPDALNPEFRDFVQLPRDPPVPLMNRWCSHIRYGVEQEAKAWIVREGATPPRLPAANSSCATAAGRC